MKTQHDTQKLPRNVINVKATAVMDNGLTRSAVSVVNLSRVGVQIEVDRATQLPPTLTLLFRNRIEHCELVWQSAQFAGLRFLDSTLN